MLNQGARVERGRNEAFRGATRHHRAEAKSDTLNETLAAGCAMAGGMAASQGADSVPRLRTGCLSMPISALLEFHPLAPLPGRCPDTTSPNLRRNLDAVPPRPQLPGTRLLRWRECNLAVWFDQFAPRLDAGASQ